MEALDSYCSSQDCIESFALNIIMPKALAVAWHWEKKIRNDLFFYETALILQLKLFPLSTSQVQEWLRIAIYQRIAIYSAIP